MKSLTANASERVMSGGLSLAFLAPKIVAVLAAGSQQPELTGVNAG